MHDSILYIVVPCYNEEEVLPETAKRLREKGCRGEIIFITSHFEFYGEGYEVDALHYLLKPVDADKLSADFYRPHRSYLISLKHVTRISRTSVTLDDRIQIPLSRGKYDDINRAFIERH